MLYDPDYDEFQLNDHLKKKKEKLENKKMHSFFYCQVDVHGHRQSLVVGNILLMKIIRTKGTW